MTVRFESILKHTDNTGANFTYETPENPTVVTRSQNYLGELVRVENDAELTIGNVVFDGGAKWEGGKIEITDDGKGTAGSVTNNNNGVKASSPIIVNKGTLTLDDGATLQNNDNFYGQAGTGFGSQYYGGGIRNEGAGSLSMLSGSTITGCYAREGGAILNINKPGTDAYIEGGNPSVLVDGGIIEGNASQMKGAAVQTIYGGADTTVKGGKIENNFSLHDLGTFAVEEGGSLTVSGNVKVSAGENNDNAIYVYNKYGDDDYAGATNKPFIEGNGAAELNIKDEAKVNGTVFLDDPCKVYGTDDVYYNPYINLDGYTGNDKIIVGLEDGREFGGIVAKTDNTSKDKIDIFYDAESKTGDFVSQQLIRDDSGFITYNGYVINVDQTEPDKLKITGICDDSAREITLTVGGKTYTLPVSDGVIDGVIDLSDVDGNSFTNAAVKVILSDDSEVNGVIANLGVIKLDRGTGYITSPEGTQYKNTNGEFVALTDGILPNDIAIADGVSEFIVNGKEISVKIGEREILPENIGGEIYDFNKDNIIIDTVDNVEYNLLDKDGQLVYGSWQSGTDGRLTFEDLTPGSEYSVVARKKAGGNTLPSVYNKTADVTTLTQEEQNKKDLFIKATEDYAKALEDAGIETLTQENYGNLSDEEKTQIKNLAENAVAAYDMLDDATKALQHIQDKMASAFHGKKTITVSDITDLGETVKADTDDIAVKAMIDEIVGKYCAEAEAVEEYTGANGVFGLIYKKADAAIRVIDRYDEIKTENGDELGDIVRLDRALAQQLSNIDNSTDESIAADTLDALRALENAKAESIIDKYYKDIVESYSELGIISDEQKQNITDVYVGGIEHISDVETTEAVDSYIEKVKLDLDKAVAMAILNDYAIGIENADDILNAAQTATNAQTDKAGIDSVVDEYKLLLDKQRAKEAIINAAGDNPTNAVRGIADKYTNPNGVIDKQTTKDAVELERDRAIAEFTIENIRNSVKDDIYPNYSYADRSGAENAIDSALSAELKKLADAVSKDEFDDIVHSAAVSAEEARIKYDHDKIVDQFGGVSDKELSDITSDDLDNIDAALKEIEKRTPETKNTETFRQLRDDLLIRKKAAIIAGLEESNDGTANVADMVEYYIEKINAVDIGGDSEDDEAASVELDFLKAKANDGVEFEKYKNRIIAELEDRIEDGDSLFVKQIIADKQEIVASLDFDDEATLESEKSRVDAAVESIDDELALQRFKDSAVEEYKKSHLAIIGSELEDCTAIYDVINAQETYDKVNEVLGDEVVKLLSEQLAREKDSDNVKEQIDEIIGKVNDTVTAANEEDFIEVAKVSEQLSVTVDDELKSIKTAVDDMREAEKTDAKTVVSDKAKELGIDDLPEAQRLINNANSKIDNSDYDDYDEIIDEVNGYLELLKAVEDCRKEFIDMLEDIKCDGDSPAVNDLVEDAKSRIRAIAFNENDSIDKHKAAMQTAYDKLEPVIYTQRLNDYLEKADALIKDDDNKNVIAAVEAIKDEMKAVSKPTVSDLEGLLEKAKIAVATERLKNDYANSPQTGDSGNVILFMLLFLAIVSKMIALSVYGRKNKYHN